MDPLQGRTQLRAIEVAVVVDPALNVRIVHIDQFLQGLVTALMRIAVWTGDTRDTLPLATFAGRTGSLLNE